MSLDLIILFVGGAIALSKLFGGSAQKPPPKRERVGGGAGRSRPTTLEELLAEMQRQLDPPVPTRESAPEEGYSLEGEVIRPEREVVDFDSGIEAVIAQRAREAAARDGALSETDHRLFDAKVRRIAAPVTAPPARIQELRRALVWNEILGTPKGLQRD